MRAMIGLIVAGFVGVGLGGCADSGPARRNIDAVYRFENLRTPATGASVGGAPVQDEWAPIRTILARASSKPPTVTRTAIRPLGNVEVANYEAKCLLPSLMEFSKVESDLEALGQADRPGRERIEAYLSQIVATYKSNFVLATVSVSVSGAGVAGHRVSVYGVPGQPPVTTTINPGGTWSARLAVVPEAKWVYGASEDPSGVVPARFFRLNVTTRVQERVEEKEFRQMFPPVKEGAPAPPPPPATSADRAERADRASPVGDSRDRRDLDAKRRIDEATIRARREEAERNRAAGLDAKGRSR